MDNPYIKLQQKHRLLIPHVLPHRSLESSLFPLNPTFQCLEACVPTNANSQKCKHTYTYKDNNPWSSPYIACPLASHLTIHHCMALVSSTPNRRDVEHFLFLWEASVDRVWRAIQCRTGQSVLYSYRTQRPSSLVLLYKKIFGEMCKVSSTYDFQGQEEADACRSFQQHGSPYNMSMNGYKIFPFLNFI